MLSSAHVSSMDTSARGGTAVIVALMRFGTPDGLSAIDAMCKFAC
jgi:hypothetical protein